MSNSIEGIGDLESQKKGTAARKNAGKAVWSYMPLQQVALLMRTLQTKNADIDLPELTNQLGWFQATGLFKDAVRFLTSSYKYLMHVTGTDFNEASKMVIQVWELGEKKYARFNWMKGMPWSEVINSAQRHIMALYGGEEIDEDSGEHHGAHLICNAMMLVHFVEFYPEGNDLPTKWFTK